MIHLSQTKSYQFQGKTDDTQERFLLHFSKKANAIHEYLAEDDMFHIYSVDDIIYIKSDADYTEIFIPPKKHLSAEPLRYWQENLNGNQFVRIHKSYIINASKIEKIVGNQVYLNEGKIVPIGRAYKDDFIHRFVK